MFTGIIQGVGKVAKLQRVSAGLKLAINLKLLSANISPGDSVAVNGVCLTATNRVGEMVYFDVVEETLQRSNLDKLKIGEAANIELAIRAGEPFGGHFVQGHIDGTGIISRKDKIGAGYLLEVKASPGLISQMVEKGSIAIDGISLTLISLKRDRFTVVLITYTIKHTNLGKKSRGAMVNLEVDMMGKWVKKLLEQHYIKPISSLRELL